VDKGPEAFRTISEVADDLDLPQHVLRFWETRFAQIKPLKRGGGRRYYRPDDVTLLRGIKHLLYGEGYTIKGVQRILREQGPKHVMMLWREAGEGEDEEDMAPMPAMPEMFAPHRAPAEPRIAEEREMTEERMAEPPVRHHPVDEPERTQLHAPVVRAPEPVAEPRPVAPALAREDQVAAPRLSREDVKQLQLTLYELLECKEILDAAR
jgi:DNA-binding transcriptional MerR regulator